MTLGFLVQQAVRKRGEEYLTYPQRALFDRIGIRRQVLETDPWGNFLLSGYDYGTAAQLGTPRDAVPRRRYLERAAAVARRVDDVCQHPGAGVAVARSTAGSSG
jgi:hypothetical protein